MKDEKSKDERQALRQLSLILTPLNLYSLIQDNTRKSIPCRAKAAQVEESKKGYTGDALALRGDERRDKLR